MAYTKISIKTNWTALDKVADDRMILSYERSEFS